MNNDILKIKNGDFIVGYDEPKEDLSRYNYTEKDKDIKKEEVSFKAPEWWNPEDEAEAEAVNHPKHYQILGIEVLDVIKESLTKEEYMGYLKGNCIKYQLRAKNKNGNQDWAKSGFYNKVLKDIIEDV